jgi:hypothetical protein
MKSVILGFSLLLVITVPVACRLGGGNPEPQMQPVLTSDKVPSGVDPGLHVNTSLMEAGAQHSSMGAESMGSATDPMAQPAAPAAMKTGAPGDKGMGPMTKNADGAQPRAATAGGPTPRGGGMKMDAGMPMDGGMKAGCCGDSPMRRGPAMPAPAASSHPMPGPASSQQPMPMAPMGDDGHM